MIAIAGLFSSVSISAAVVSGRGAQRWDAGHPWIYRSDLIQPKFGRIEGNFDVLKYAEEFTRKR